MADPSTKRWPVIQDILKREGIARQHLNSFDEFLENGLQSIINEVGQIEIENAEYPYKIQLEKVKLQKPRMMELDTSQTHPCLLYTSPSPRDRTRSRMPSSA